MLRLAKKDSLDTSQPLQQSRNDNSVKYLLRQNQQFNPSSSTESDAIAYFESICCGPLIAMWSFHGVTVKHLLRQQVSLHLKLLKNIVKNFQENCAIFLAALAGLCLTLVSE